jgi:hypothetical protein
MFGGVTKVLSEGVGTADNCSVYFGQPNIQAKSDYLQFILPDEQPQILMKCTKGEYIFTDCGFTVIFGEAAAGRKRQIRRFDYREHAVHDIAFETCGVVDNDCTMTLNIGSTSISIDIKKPEQELGIKVYRILHALSIVQEAEKRYFALASSAFNAALGSSLTSDPAALNNLIGISMQGAESIANRYNRRSYRDVFEQALG